MDNIIKIIKERRSVRAYKDKSIEKEKRWEKIKYSLLHPYHNDGKCYLGCQTFIWKVGVIEACDKDGNDWLYSLEKLSKMEMKWIIESSVYSDAENLLK